MIFLSVFISIFAVQIGSTPEGTPGIRMGSLRTRAYMHRVDLFILSSSWAYMRVHESSMDGCTPHAYTIRRWAYMLLWPGYLLYTLIGRRSVVQRARLVHDGLFLSFCTSSYLLVTLFAAARTRTFSTACRTFFLYICSPSIASRTSLGGYSVDLPALARWVHDRGTVFVHEGKRRKKRKKK